MSTKATHGTLPASQTTTTRSSQGEIDLHEMIEQKCMSIVNAYQAGHVTKAQAMIRLYEAIPQTDHAAYATYQDMLDNFDRFTHDAGQ